MIKLRSEKLLDEEFFTSWNVSVKFKLLIEFCSSIIDDVSMSPVFLDYLSAQIASSHSKKKHWAKHQLRTLIQ